MGNSTLGFVLLIIFFLLAVTTFAFIEPFKEALDNNRGTSSLNCPGTVGHDETDYNNDTSFEKLVRRPTCFVTGMSMVWFIAAFLIAAVSWVVKNWRKVSA